MNNIKTIEIKNLSKSYSNKQVFNNLSFTFEYNHIYVIKGISGVGKTTLVNLIGLIDQADSGDILYDGISYQQTKNNMKLDFIQSNIAYLFQGTNLYTDLTLYDNLLLVNSHQDSILEISKALGIDTLLNTKTLNLSKGEKARAGVAKALLENKPIVLMDEPAANLDNNKALWMYDVIKTHTQDKITILISHERDVTLPFSYDALTLDSNGMHHSYVKQTDREVYQIINKEPGKKKILYKLSYGLFKQHWLKMLLFSIVQILLSLLLLLMSSSMVLNENERVLNALEDSQLYYVEANQTNQANLEYLSMNLNVKHQNDYIYLNTYFSEDDTFIFKSKTFSLEANQAIIPQSVQDTYGITIGSIIYVDDAPIQVVGIYEDDFNWYSSKVLDVVGANHFNRVLYETIPVFMSNHVLKSISYKKTINGENTTFSNIRQAIKEVTGLYTTVDSIEFDQNRYGLVEDQVMLIMSESLQTHTQASLLELINQTFYIKDTHQNNEFNLNQYLSNVTVRGIVYDPTLNYDKVKIMLSDDLKTIILDEVFHNHWITNEQVMLPIINELSMNMSSIQINTYDIIPINQLEFYKLNASVKQWMISLTLGVIILNMGLFSMVLLGLQKGFRKHNLLLHNSGFLQPYRMGILVLPVLIGYLLSSFLTILISSQDAFILFINHAFGFNTIVVYPYINMVFIIITFILLISIVINGFIYTRLNTSNIIKIIKS